MRNRDAPRRLAAARAPEIGAVVLRVQESHTIRRAAATSTPRLSELPTSDQDGAERLARLRTSGRESGMTHVAEHLATLGLGAHARGLTSAVPVVGGGAPVRSASRAWTGDGGLATKGGSS
jgi:hypothetical protein